MTAESLSIALMDPQQGHAALSKGWEWAKAQLMAERPVAVEFKLLEDARSLQRNREYWGFVLRPISEQAQLAGIGATVDGWHDFYRLMFLGYEFTSVRLPGKKRPSVRKKLKSTTKLSEKAMRKYCEEVRAHAATTFGVEFPAMPQDLGTPVKKLSRKRREVVDAETGEIVEVA